MPNDSIIFTDSRGAGLQDLLWANDLRKNLTNSILAKEIKGANLRNLADSAISFSQDFPTYDIYIAGGVCDITWKHPITKQIKFLHANQAVLTSHITDILDEIDGRMHGCCPSTKFIYCPLIGVDVWNYIPHIANDIPNLQDLITNAVIDVNKHILRLNQKHGSRMPHFASAVHSWKHNKFHHHYELLAKDGIHLTKELKVKWADQLLKAIRQN